LNAPFAKLSRVKLVLVKTTHPGNLGAVARAMKNMGLTRLCLVAPKLFPHAEATARAAGADDILAQAEVVDSLDAALVGCGLVIATSARSRRLPWPLLNPRQAASQVLAEAGDHDIAVLFGQEQSGLSNDELARGHYHVHIPTEPGFNSLNLAAAVLLMCYELRMALQADVVTAPSATSELATADEMAAFYQHLQTTLYETQFIRPENSQMMMRRLQRLFNRTRLEKTEVNILRGILTAAENNQG